MADDVVELSLDGPLAVVTLRNGPLNIFNLAMRDGLIEALRAVNDIYDVRAIVLRADGRHFSAGADLSEFGTADSIMEARRIRWDRDPWGLLWDLRVPTVVAKHAQTGQLVTVEGSLPPDVLAQRLGLQPPAAGS